MVIFSSRVEQGQGLVEYAFIISLIAIVVLIVFLLLGEAIENLFNETINTLVKTL